MPHTPPSYSSDSVFPLVIMLSPLLFIRYIFQFSLPLYTPVHTNYLPSLSTCSETQIDLHQLLCISVNEENLVSSSTLICAFHGYFSVIRHLPPALVLLQLYTNRTISRICPLFVEDFDFGCISGTTHVT
jgi:hypothetical protein